jgi:hypothetical protein
MTSISLGDLDSLIQKQQKEIQGYVYKSHKWMYISYLIGILGFIAIYLYKDSLDVSYCTLQITFWHYFRYANWSCFVSS